jgi:hypothetical protein
MTSPVAMKAIEGTSESISPPIARPLTPTLSPRALPASGEREISAP